VKTLIFIKWKSETFCWIIKDKEFFGKIVNFFVSEILYYIQKSSDIYKAFTRVRACHKKETNPVLKVSKSKFAISNLKVFHLNIQNLRPK
jgi:hypothetical protein